MPMVSKVFSTQALELDQIRADLKALVELSPDQREALQKFWSDGRLTIKDEALGTALTDFLRKESISAEAFHRTQRLLLFLKTSCMEGDTPEILVQDVVQIGSLETSTRPYSAVDFLLRMVPALMAASEEGRREDALFAGMAFLTGVSYVCDVRMVPDQAFRPLKDSSASYRPKAVDWIPVALVTLSTNQETKFTFQIDLHRLNTFFEVLSAAKSDRNWLAR